MKSNALLMGILLMSATMALATGCDRTDGLVLHYPFDADEGRVLTDASGSGRFAWLHGGTWVPNGARGGAIRFESGDQYLVADDAGLPRGDAPRTMALWVKLDTRHSDPLTALLTYGTETWNQMSGIGLDWRVGRANFYFTQCGGVALSDWRMEEAGTWHHLAYVYEGSGRHRFYVDGVPGDGMSELMGSLDTVLSGAVIVGAFSQLDGPGGGYIDDVRIYNRALSAKKIAELAVRDEEPEGDLLLHYTFDADAPGGAMDSSPYGNDGILHGTTVMEDGGFSGNALRFDGAGAYIRVPSSDSLMPEEITLSVWVQLDGLPDDIDSLIFKRNQGYNHNEAYSLQVTPPGAARFVLGNGQGQQIMDSQVLLEPDRWHHVAATFRQPEMNIYVDGVLAATATYDHPLQHNPVADLLIGARDHMVHGMDSFVRTGMDDVRIYRRALSAETIAELAQQPEPETGLLLHYPFDADEGNVVSDASGSGRIGQVYGATWVPDGIQGGAMRFESGDQFILADDAGLPSGDSPRTMALWVKLDSLYPDPGTMLLTYGTYVWNQMSTISMDWRVGRANFVFTQCGAVALSEWRMEEAGTWYHLAYVYAGEGQHRFYVDGVPGNGMSELWGGLNTVLSGALFVGASPGGTGPNSGDLDDVRIYNRALSAEEIAVLAQRPEGANGPEGGTILSESSLLPEPFEVQRVVSEGGGHDCMVVRWTSVPGQVYAVYWTDDMTRRFRRIASGLVAEDSAMVYSNCLAEFSKTGFFAVRVQTSE